MKPTIIEFNRDAYLGTRSSTNSNDKTLQNSLLTQVIAPQIRQRASSQDSQSRKNLELIWHIMLDNPLTCEPIICKSNTASRSRDGITFAESRNPAQPRMRMPSFRELNEHAYREALHNNEWQTCLALIHLMPALLDVRDWQGHTLIRKINRHDLHDAFIQLRRVVSEQQLIQQLDREIAESKKIIEDVNANTAKADSKSKGEIEIAIVNKD